MNYRVDTVIAGAVEDTYYTDQYHPALTYAEVQAMKFERIIGGHGQHMGPTWEVTIFDEGVYPPEPTDTWDSEGGRY